MRFLSTHSFSEFKWLLAPMADPFRGPPRTVFLLGSAYPSQELNICVHQGHTHTHKHTPPEVKPILDSDLPARANTLSVNVSSHSIILQANEMLIQP